MYRDLIIGFDDSPSARDAVAFARRLALATGARPMALYSSAAAWSDDEDIDDRRSLAIDADIEAKRAAAKRLLAGVPDATFEPVAESSPAFALHRAADEADAGLIVLGATHRTGLGRTVPGSTADAVIHGAPCAVAIVPSGYADIDRPQPFGLVAAGVDGGDETERVARVAARIARRGGAALRLLTVADVPFSDGPAYAGNLGYASLRDVIGETVAKTLDRAAGVAADTGAPVETRVVNGKVGDAIARESADADLLVIGSRGYGPLRRVVLGSETNRILRAATCPVLVVPRRTAEELDDAVVPFGAALRTSEGVAVAGEPATPAG
jgi:nucleotide-binding universal stress UspA family protein